MADWYVSSVAWAAIPQFAASTAYTVGNIVRPLTAPAFGAQYAFRCTTAGTSSTEPSWPTGNNSTVTTGGATFTNVAAQSAYGWGAAAGNIFAIGGNGAGPRIVSGDRVFLSSDHAENMPTASLALATGGSGFGLIQAISVNRAGSVPPVAADQQSGASITISGNNPTMEAYRQQYWQGITFTFSGTGRLSFNVGGYQPHYFRNCAFVFGASSQGILSNSSPAKVTLDGTPIQFGAVGQTIQASQWDLEMTWVGTTISGTVPTALFTTGGAGGFLMATLRGIDLSSLSTTLFNPNVNAVGPNKLLLDSCRIASGVTRFGTVNAGNSASDELELINCYDGTRFVTERYTAAGGVTKEFATTMVGGATDAVGLFSHKMVSSVRSDLWSLPLDGFWLDVQNPNVGGSHTATVELIASAALNNTDIKLSLEYQGTTGSSLATFADSVTSMLTSAVPLPTSTGVTWNSPPSTPVMQHLSITFTQQTAGRLRALVRLGKPSTTVWYNPQIALT